MKTVYYFLCQRAQAKALFHALTIILLFTVASAVNSAKAQGCVLACPPMEPPVPISLSDLCQDDITAELVGYTPQDCDGPFSLELFDESGQSLGTTIDASMIGGVFMAVITADGPGDAGQNCMTAITVLDKQPPIVSCPDDVTVDCPTPLEDIPPLTQEDIEDCSPVEIDYVDIPVFDGMCDGEIVSKFTRKYFIIDVHNNVYTCTQMISLAKVELESVEWPEDLLGDDAIPCFPDPDLSPENTGSPSINGDPIANGNICNLLVTSEDFPIDVCSGGYKIQRTWTVMDWCDNTSTQQIQFIEVKDFTGPEVDVDEYLQVDAGPDCTADVLLPPADITEDCSTEWTVRMEGPFGTIESNGGLVMDLPAGVHQIIYIAINDCSQEGRDTLMLEISDESTPTALCNSSVSVPLNTTGMAVVPADGFDGGSFDNCGDIYYKVKRMSAPAGYDCFNDNNILYRFDDEVKFCCEDVDNGPIMVIMRVYDTPPVPGPVNDDYLQGRFTDCMITVEVQDKIGPEIECPTNLTISCEYPFDPENLDVFGKIAMDPADRDEICIDDPGNPWTIGVECIGLDGLASDNCSVIIEEEPSMIMDSLCGTGLITRTFTATDPGGRSVSCEQTITITNYTPFNAGNIDWPDDYVTSDICEIDALEPENLPYPWGEPVLTSDACDLVTFNHTDEIFDFSGNSEACFKILRHWVVIDWCQIDGSSPDAGRWEHLQVLKVKNLVPPTITDAPDDIVQCGDVEDCGPGDVVLEASATDDCTDDETLLWRITIDENNDGSFEHILPSMVGSSVSVPRQFPQGTHRVLYTVQDFCGNKATTEQLIEIQNCTPPSAKCQNITTTLMPVDLDDDGTTDWGMVTIWASDLDAGSDHPCGTNVTVAFSTDPNDQNMVFNCDDIGPNQVDLYVIDDNGLTDFCTVTVTIQDNNTVCPQEGTTGTISGAIGTASDAMMSEVMVELGGSTLEPVYTAEGHYEFPVMPFGGVYEVMPQHDVDPTNGVSTIDLIQIQKHLLGIELFDTPYKYIAADANKSGSVSAVDILELKKLLLGFTEELPQNTSWRFVDAAYEWIDPDNPLQEQFAESYVIDPFQTDMVDVNFVGIKIGDINESAQVFTGGGEILTGRKAIDLIMPDVAIDQGAVQTITLSAADLDAVEALQFTLKWNPADIEVLEVIPGPRSSNEQWNGTLLEEGLLPFSWHALEMPYSATDVLFEVTLRAKRDIDSHGAFTLSSDVTEEEGLTSNGLITRPDLRFGGGHDTYGEDLVVGQNRPNPFSGHTIIPFEISKATGVELTVTDALGRLVYTTRIDATEGYNEFELNASDLGVKGLVFYTIETTNNKQTNRMIIVEE